MKHFQYPSDPGVICGEENNPDLFIRTVVFPVGYSEEQFHSHPNTFEFYQVLSGELVFESKDGDVVKSSQRAFIYFGEGEPHRIIEVTQDCELVLYKRIGSQKQTGIS